MELLESMNSVIEYVESHICDDITSEDIEKIVSHRIVDFNKVFLAITNLTINDYIRKRRLTLAAQDLIKSDMTVLECALKYGYTSPDSFTRAFRQLHDINPSQVKKSSCVLKSYGKLTFIFTIKGVSAMNYKIIEKEEIRIIGVKKWFSTKNENQMNEIPKMWKNLPKDIEHLIMGDEHGDCVGVCGKMYDEGFEYWIGSITDRICPKGLEELIIPKSKWAIFEIFGELPSSLQEVFKRIYAEWLPNSEFTHANLPEIEYYYSDDSFLPNYKTEIWIPLV